MIKMSFNDGLGYKMKRVVEQNHQEDTLEDGWQENNVRKAIFVHHQLNCEDGSDA